MASPLRPETVTLRRTGDASLRLEGVSLAAHESTRATNGARQNRWHEISVWDASSIGEGRVALQIVYRTQWDGELGHDHAEVIPREGLREALRAYDPLAHVGGLPPTPAHAERQRRLLAEIRSGWDHAVSSILDTMRIWDLGR